MFCGILLFDKTVGTKRSMGERDRERREGGRERLAKRETLHTSTLCK